MTDYQKVVNNEKVEATRKLPHVMVGLGRTIITPRVPVAAVDKDGNLYINPEGLAKTGFPAGYTVCHEALHYALRHFARAEGLDRDIANYAADCVIAVILEELFSFKPPLPYIHPDHFDLPRNLTFEQYYKAIAEKMSKQDDDNSSGSGKQANQDQNGGKDSQAQGEGQDGESASQGSGSGDGDAGASNDDGQGDGNKDGQNETNDGLGEYKSVGNSMDRERPWEEEAHDSSVNHGDESKPTIPRPVRDMSDDLRKCGVRHEDIRAAHEHAIGSSPGGAVAKMSAPVEFDSRLYDYITEQLGWGDWTYRKPRYTIRPYILPSFSGGGRVGVICDTSGSMSHTVRRVVGLINGLLVNGITVNLVEGDTECQAVHVLTSPGDLDIYGYGGTDMRQVYLDAIGHLIDCDCIVMFTDCDSLDWPTQQEITIPLVVVAVYKDYRGSCPEHIPVIYLDEREDDQDGDWS